MSTGTPAWRSVPALPSMGEAHAALWVPDSTASIWRKLLAFAGPGFLISVGYMDPGNWATDLAAGSSYNYTLLSVVMISRNSRCSSLRSLLPCVSSVVA